MEDNNLLELEPSVNNNISDNNFLSSMNLSDGNIFYLVCSKCEEHVSMSEGIEFISVRKDLNNLLKTSI